MDLKHHIMTLLCDNHLHLSPLILRILDVGTGTGIWALQMGDRHPESTVIGTDLSPIQPSWYESGHVLMIVNRSIFGGYILARSRIGWTARWFRGEVPKYLSTLAVRFRGVLHR